MKSKNVTFPRFEPLEWRKLLSNYFVSTSGSDSNSGTDESPWRSLQYAARNVVAGDTVIVRAGNYIGFSLSWDFPQNGTPEAPITFKADPGVTINARNPKTVDGIDFEGSSYIIIDGFNVAPAATEDVWRAGIRAAGGGVGNIIRNNTVTMRAADRYGIFSSFSSHMVVENNDVSGTFNSAIYTSNSADHTIIRSNNVHHTGGNGIHFNGDISQGGDGLITYALVENNTVHDVGAVVGGSAINMDGIQYSRIQNNLLYQNHAKGITLYHIDAAEGSKYNVVANNTVVQAPTATGYALSIKTGSTFNSIFNNILIGGTGFSGAMNVSYDSLLGLFSDYNIVQNAYSLNDGTTNMSLASWVLDRNLDHHSSLSTAEALFVNPAANDYHLLPGSAAINAGMNFSVDLQAPTTDITGAIRPNGQNWDAGVYEFIGPADADAPTISNIVISNIKSGRVTISWTTSEPSTGRIEYGTDDTYGTLSPIQSVLLLKHTITVTGLTPSTLYHFRVVSGDVVGNIGSSADQTVTTLPPDVIAPVLSGVGAGVVAPVYAVINWNSDEPGDSIVEFGLTTEYGASVSASVLTESHQLKLTNLLPGTTYHYRVKSSDESFNQSVSEDFTFTTSAVGQFPGGVVGYWTFGEYKGPTALDASGNNHTGTAIGGPEYVPGITGNALNFDGVNDAVRVPRAAALESAAVTVSAWVKLAEDTQVPWAVIVKKTYANDSYAPYGSYSLAMSPNGLGNLATFYTGHVSDTDELNSPTTIPTGRWVFIAGTFDPATGTKSLYVDGQLVATNTVNQPLAYDTSPAGDLYFGQDPGPGEAFSGFIDNVGVWDRVLSPSEIATMAYVAPATSILGTSGDDTIHLTLLSPSQLQVQVNGNTPYLLDPGLISALHIETLAGEDTLTFSATSGADVVLFSARGLTYQTIPMPITHNNVERVQFDSGGGTDVLYVSSDATVQLASDLHAIGLDVVSSGQLDVRDKSLFLHYGQGNPSPLDAAEFLIRNARDGGLWDRGGIGSSLADASTYNVAAFDDPSAGILTIKAVRYGDADGDGRVDIKDLYTLAMHWKQTVAHFTAGDFNYDGFVDANDLQLLALNWQASAASAQALMTVLGLAPAAPAPAPEPEPASAQTKPDTSPEVVEPAPLPPAPEAEIEPEPEPVIDEVPIIDPPAEEETEPQPQLPVEPAPAVPPAPSSPVPSLPAVPGSKPDGTKPACQKPAPLPPVGCHFNKPAAPAPAPKLAPAPAPKPAPAHAPKPAPFCKQQIPPPPPPAKGNLTSHYSFEAPKPKDLPAPSKLCAGKYK